MARVSSVLLVVVVGTLAFLGTASALPSIPSGYSMTLNTTVQLAQGGGFNTMQDAYQGYNSSLTVTFRPGPTPYQLSDGDDQTAVSYNPATRTCHAKCIGGSPCPGGNCHVYGGGIFGPLPASTANGECTFKIPGATRYTLTVQSGDGTATIGLEYCFIGNQPVYVLEKVTPTKAGHPCSAHAYKQRHLRAVTRDLVGSDNPDLVLMVVKSFDPTTPTVDVFDVPAYCSCSSATILASKSG